MLKEEPYIGVAWGSPGGATAEISIAIESLTGKYPKPRRLADLAGPNETIQVILDNIDWIKVFQTSLGSVLGGLVLAGGKKVWAIAKPKITELKDDTSSSFHKLFQGIAQAKHAKASVILGLPTAVKNSGRHIGFEVENASPEEIARIIYTLAQHGVEIEAKLREWNEKIGDEHVGYEQNTDCSVKLILTEEGSVELKAHLQSTGYKTSEDVTYLVIGPESE